MKLCDIDSLFDDAFNIVIDAREDVIYTADSINAFVNNNLNLANLGKIECITGKTLHLSGVQTAPGDIRHDVYVIDLGDKRAVVML